MADGQPIPVQLQPVPGSIPRDTLRDICHALGLDPGNVQQIHLGMNEIRATLLLTTPDGHKIRYGDGPATTVVTIPVT